MEPLQQSLRASGSPTPSRRPYHSPYSVPRTSLSDSEWITIRRIGSAASSIPWTPSALHTRYSGGAHGYSRTDDCLVAPAAQPCAERALYGASAAAKLRNGLRDREWCAASLPRHHLSRAPSCTYDCNQVSKYSVLLNSSPLRLSRGPNDSRPRMQHCPR